MISKEPLIEETNTIQPLEITLQYQNENIPHRFKKFYNVTDEEADEIFTETKRWLWLCGVNYELRRLGKIDFTLGIINGLPVIDEMWHNFVLHTEAYKDFCEEYVGGFIEHVPTTKAKDEYKKKHVEKHLAEVKVFYQNQYSLTYDILGEETCIKWYDEYATRYSKKQLEAIRKPQG